MKWFILTLILMTAVNLSAEEKMPDFSIQDIEGNVVKLSDFLGKGPVIIDFWATWCKPCLKELPQLEMLSKKYEDLTVLAISTDKPRKLSAVKKLIKSQKYTFTVLLDPNGEDVKLLNIKDIPRTFMVDKDGTIIYDHSGYVKGDVKHLEEILIKQMEEMKLGETPIEPEMQPETQVIPEGNN